MKGVDYHDVDCHGKCFPNLSDYIKKHKLYSGNIDIRHAKALFKLYGIPLDDSFSVREKENLLTIKNKRKTIAHGESNLTDASKGISIETIDLIASDAELVLTKFIDSLDVFLTERRFILS